MILVCEDKMLFKVINNILLSGIAILDIVAGNTYIYAIRKSEIQGFYAEV